MQIYELGVVYNMYKLNSFQIQMALSKVGQSGAVSDTDTKHKLIYLVMRIRLGL